MGKRRKLLSNRAWAMLGGAVVAGLFAGVILGRSLDITPLDDGTPAPTTLPDRQRAATARAEDNRGPDRYALDLPGGRVPVSELDQNGRLRDRRMADRDGYDRIYGPPREFDFVPLGGYPGDEANPSPRSEPEASMASSQAEATEPAPAPSPAPHRETQQAASNERDIAPRYRDVADVPSDPSLPGAAGAMVDQGASGGSQAGE